ncbi:Zinc transporter 3 [Acorus calamus]|uniref:Zinc transporter 3 n=1 Tax=Acorus calamus TaxID=4465 RepID=A0AAV9CDC7_ACOCL|nr:Zinc transporter 3 [Acorus calamus]
MFILLVHVCGAADDCSLESDQIRDHSQAALKLKSLAIFSLLISGAMGVVVPQLGRTCDALRPEGDLFIFVKAFAAGVILATGLIHILPEAFEHLTSSCLDAHPWHEFPVAGFVAMISAIVTLIMDTAATGYYTRLHANNTRSPRVAETDNTVFMPTLERSHVHGPEAANGSGDTGSTAELIRHRMLELGMLIHSVIIGVSLGVSQSPSTIKPLIAALSFHQFFEGIGLGGSIVQARFTTSTTAIMSSFFAFTTPAGITIGIVAASSYNENSPTALIIEGLLNAASAGVLIYMALVDFIAADFISPRMHGSIKLQLGCYVSLLLGAGLMSLLAIWS